MSAVVEDLIQTAPQLQKALILADLLVGESGSSALRVSCLFLIQGFLHVLNVPAWIINVCFLKLSRTAKEHYEVAAM